MLASVRCHQHLPVATNLFWSSNVRCYQPLKRAGLINLLERQLERLIVPAILEYEEISGLSGAVGARAPPAPSAGPARLKHELTNTRDILRLHAVDTALTVVIFKQVYQ